MATLKAEEMIRPREHLRVLSQKYPDAWKRYDMIREGMKNDLPVWCYCTVAAARSIACEDDSPQHLGGEADIPLLAALASWRLTQTIYRFDPTLIKELGSTSIETVPTDVLFNMPEWCIYIESPRLTWMGNRLAGFFCHLDWDAERDSKVLRLLFDYAGANPGILVPHQVVLGHQTLGEVIAAVLDETKQQMTRLSQARLDKSIPEQLAEVMRLGLEPALSMITYLCSGKAKIGAGQRGYPTAYKTKKGYKFFPPDHPVVITVGSRTEGNL
ncbi:hypothetical protein [Desulfogranum japonicum]|uniref:hypothetical protein n=1 Tax=Desulfogranum japonicum TaxID=231447 RepID=UPI0004103805|nr:hypothetical protein [Desulfogranum japonicum]